MSNDKKRLTNVFTKMFRDANVEVTTTRTSQNEIVPSIIVDGDKQHTFSKNARISKALRQGMTTDDIAMRLSGGQYFFVDDKLVDWRDSNYRGIIQTDQMIDELIDVVGISGGGTNRDNTTAKNIYLGAQYSDNPIEIPALGEGGKLSSRLSFKWNPFAKDVNSDFELVRLICTNGMTGLTSFLNTRIPILNLAQENLDVANIQIQRKIDSKVDGRFMEMVVERATIDECSKIEQHASNRLAGVKDFKEVEVLKRIANVASPEFHLSKFYKESAFKDSRLSAQMPSHLVVMDVWNMATEMATHTTETSDSTDQALHKIANDIVFSREDLTGHQARFGQVDTEESDPERAFFGRD